MFKSFKMGVGRMKTVICGIDYDVKEIEPNSRADTFMGRSDIVKGEITINKTMSKQQKEQTLIHEWIHCVLDNYCFEEGNNEHLVQTLASELYRNGFKVICK